LVGFRELAGSARERGLLGFASCERAAMFVSKGLWKPLSEALGKQREEAMDE
jgi:hypothetical protein